MKKTYGYVVYYLNVTASSQEVSIYRTQDCGEAKEKVQNLLKMMFEDSLYFRNDKQFIAIIDLLDRREGKVIYQFSYTPESKSFKKFILSEQRRLTKRVRNYQFKTADKLRYVNLKDIMVSISYNLDLNGIDGIFWSETSFLLEKETKSKKYMRRLISSPYHNLTICNTLFQNTTNIGHTIFPNIPYADQKETAASNYDYLKEAIQDCYNLSTYPYFDFGS